MTHAIILIAACVTILIGLFVIGSHQAKDGRWYFRRYKMRRWTGSGWEVREPDAVEEDERRARDAW